MHLCELGLGGDGHWLSEPTTWLRIMGKEIYFHKTDPIMLQKKNGLQDFYDIYVSPRRFGRHIVFALVVCPSVRLSQNHVRSVTQKPFEIYSWNFTQM